MREDRIKAKKAFSSLDSSAEFIRGALSDSPEDKERALQAIHQAMVLVSKKFDE